MTPHEAPPGAAAWMFPGQGSQVRGMGRELFDRFPRAVAAAEAELGYSLRQLCLEDPDGLLSRTSHTQPALFVVSALALLARRADAGRGPDIFVGHSLGELVALFGAGAYDFATGLRLVRERGRLMSLATGGAMAAVIGLDQERVAAVIARGALPVDIANLNLADQIVVSGEATAIERAAASFAEAGARVVRLNVSGAFHSRHMRDAAREFAAFVTGLDLRPLQASVISNVTARPYPREDYGDLLVRQLSEPVRWHQSMRWLLDRDVAAIEEVGPGRVLTGMLVRIRRERDAAPARPVPASLAPITPPRAAPAVENVFMYSGMGSQYFGMGRQLYRGQDVFRRAFDRCAAIFAEATGRDLPAELFDAAPGSGELTETTLAQPALFATSFGLTELLIGEGVEPHAVVGYSAGNLVAAVVSGALTLAEGFGLSVGLAGLYARRLPRGTMLSVLASHDHFEARPELYRGTSLAAVNYDSHFVVSGPEDVVASLRARLGGLGIIGAPVAVEHAFHGPDLDVVEPMIRTAFDEIGPREPRLPFWSAGPAGRVERVDADFFWHVARRPVRFDELLRRFDGHTPMHLVDAGPSGTLSSFVRHSGVGRLPASTALNRFGRDRQTIEQTVAAARRHAGVAAAAA